MVRVAALLCLVALAVTACGSSTHATRTASKACRDQRIAVAKVNAAIDALQLAKKGVATDNATDHFLLVVDTAPISNLQRNRLIDHAAAAVATKCPQCFQALEAERPIPAIAHGDTGCK